MRTPPRERGHGLKPPSERGIRLPPCSCDSEIIPRVTRGESMSRRELPLQSAEDSPTMRGARGGSNFGWNHERARPFADGAFFIFITAWIKDMSACGHRPERGGTGWNPLRREACVYPLVAAIRKPPAIDAGREYVSTGAPVTERRGFADRARSMGAG